MPPLVALWRQFSGSEWSGFEIGSSSTRLGPPPSAEHPEVDLESLKPKPIQPVSLKGHPLVGTWYYGAHSREITADGWCTLREGDNVIWKRRCISKTENGMVLDGNLTHELKGDVLDIEGRYKARKP